MNLLSDLLREILTWSFIAVASISLAGLLASVWSAIRDIFRVRG